MISSPLHIQFLGIRIHSFHFFGGVGFASGMILGIILSWQLNLLTSIILVMTGIGVATFFILVFAARWITAKETIVYYHHEIAILIFCSITLKALHYPVLPYLDITVLGIGTFLGFGRIGCYSVGCCHGRPRTHGVKYGQEHVNAGFTWYYKDVPLLPVQLVESVYVFLIVFTGIILLLHYVMPGTVLVVYTVIYGSMRYLLEFLRGDPERPYWLGLSEAQWTTLLLVAVTLLLSFTGHLPLYNWHWLIFSLLTAISCYVVFVKNKKIDYKILKPKHVQEIATALQYSSSLDNHSVNFKKNTINIYQTDQGLSVSLGYTCEQNHLIKHYTLSGNHNFKLDAGLVNKIANMIGLIQKHDGQFELIEKQDGIYHIVFDRGNLQEIKREATKS